MGFVYICNVGCMRKMLVKVNDGYSNDHANSPHIVSRHIVTNGDSILTSDVKATPKTGFGMISRPLASNPWGLLSRSYTQDCGSRLTRGRTLGRSHTLLALSFSHEIDGDMGANKQEEV